MMRKADIQFEIRWHERCIVALKEQGLTEHAKEHEHRKDELEIVLGKARSRGNDRGQD